ncbi:hypothetical protein [Nocardia sp. NPDC050406]|uniref:DUF3885 domain-containing protein n=1 Tax=Nocardia sp. NPDC050406 TaxID=3364318 RepID=UPI0037A9A95B
MHGSDLSELWQRQWPRCAPLAPQLKLAYPERWVRFHSLPASKRYPEGADEYAVVLDRYNTILDELFSGQDIYVVTCAWSNLPEPDTQGTHHWMSICDDPTEPDPEFTSYTHLFATRTAWRRGTLDELLRAVADDTTAGVMITDLTMTQIHHPYDGGADVLLPTTSERDSLGQRYSEWLSQSPQGL